MTRENITSLFNFWTVKVDKCRLTADQIKLLWRKRQKLNCTNIVKMRGLWRNGTLSRKLCIWIVPEKIAFYETSNDVFIVRVQTLHCDICYAVYDIYCEYYAAKLRAKDRKLRDLCRSDIVSDKRKIEKFSSDILYTQREMRSNWWMIRDNQWVSFSTRTGRLERDTHDWTAEDRWWYFQQQLRPSAKLSTEK